MRKEGTGETAQCATTLRCVPHSSISMKAQWHGATPATPVLERQTGSQGELNQVSRMFTRETPESSLRPSHTYMCTYTCMHMNAQTHAHTSH